MNLRPATAVRETGGPTTLTTGAVADGTIMKRSGATWIGSTVAAIMGTLLTTVGDLLVFDGTAKRKAVGADCAVLTANSDQADGLEWVNAAAMIYGDGQDGDATLGTSTMTGPKSYNNLTVTGTLNTAGYALKVRGKLTFGASGIIHNGGANAAGSGAGLGGTSNQFGGGGAGNNGAAGASTGGNGTNATNSWLGLRGAAGAGKGGNGGQGNGGGSHPGGTGQTPTAPIAQRSSIGLSVYDTGNTVGNGAVIALAGGSGGAAGGGDNAGATAGAGGGGGGVCIVAAREVDASAGGIIHADGGNGSNGAIAGGALAAGGGGGGGGGVALLLYARAHTLPTVRANGGSAGNGAGTGAAGTAGAAGYATSIRTV